MPPPLEFLQPELIQDVDQAAATYTERLKTHRVSFGAFRQAPWHHFGLQALENSQLTIRSPFMDNEVVRTAFLGPDSGISNESVCLRLIQDGNRALSNVPTDRGLGEAGAIGAAHRRALHFQFRAEYAYDYGMPDWLVAIDRRISAFKPERLFLGRHKFLHYRFWYRYALSSYVRDLLLNPRALSRPYLDSEQVRNAVEGHLQGKRNVTVAIHKLLTLELIHRLFIDSSSRERSLNAEELQRRLDQPRHLATQSPN
jgi:asparagine synthase (glutamine-hydrolysing)